MASTICARCGQPTTDGLTSPIGTVCPDCFDKVADGDNRTFRAPAAKPPRGIRVDGTTVTVAIRYEDGDIRRALKSDWFLWNPEQKVWECDFSSPEGARDHAIRLAAKHNLPVLGDDEFVAEYQRHLEAEAAEAARIEAQNAAYRERRRAEVAGTWTITDEAGNTITVKNPADRDDLHDRAARWVRNYAPIRNRALEITVAGDVKPDATTNDYELKIDLPKGSAKAYATVHLSRTA